MGVRYGEEIMNVSLTPELEKFVDGKVEAASTPMRAK
jgi:hypothetical protein